MQEIEKYWGRPLQATICENCDWDYMLPPDQELPTCPHCYGQTLTHLPAVDVRQNGVPELVVPFSVREAAVEKKLNQFSRQFYFSPTDLQARNLIGRLRQVYIPAWMVDSDVNAVWQVEAGFDYQVVSHQEKFAGDSWHTQEVKETKVRWETRKGKLQRRYDNVRAPALDDIRDVRGRLGAFDSDGAVPYEPTILEGSMIRLPNRDPEDAWSDTHPTFKVLAAEECRHAARADHIRQYKWQAEYTNQNWSLLLLPLFSTWYVDDDGRPQAVLLNGRTGQIWGVMRASMKRARRFTILLGVFAVLLFLLTIILAFWEPSLAFLSALLGFGVGLGAIWPIIYVSRFNRHRSTQPWDNP